jgi:nucleotide-binding universal stress UspA family protein
MFQKILVAFDSANGSAQALETAVELARMSGAELRMLVVETHLPRYPATIGEVEDAQEAADQSAHLLIDHAYLRALQAGVPFQSEVRAGSATRTILEVAAHERADLLVLGAIAPLARVRISHHAPCSVLLVR